jgi:Protein of unknown function (DUF1569)
MNPYASFLQTDMLRLLTSLQPNTPAKWGVMNAQQMIEHLENLFLISAGHIPTQPLFDEERTRKNYQYIIVAQNPFPRNIKVNKAFVIETLKYASLEAAVEGLKNSSDVFFAAFAKDYEAKRLHPAFGGLDYMEWLYFHYTHVIHHFMQFGLIEEC